ncbi:MAG: hypothetical protein DRN04_10880 [Thermoprotei archaeon]|nr:MAG: hypothetical protein DRN04_10880 [Thermoprotei archaeon]
MKFVEWLRSRKEYSPNTLHKYLVALRKILSWLAVHGRTLEEMTYEDYLKMTSELNNRKIPENLKLILKFLWLTTEDERYMKLYQKVKVPVDKGKAVDVLTEEQVSRLIEACGQVDYELKLLVELLYETGARVGELLNLRVRDVSFDQHGARLYIRRSKSEFRVVRAVLYATDLLRFIEGRADEEYVFTKNYNTFLRHLSQAWELAGLPSIRRKFHILRHSRATELLRKRIFTEQEMMKWFGWKTRKMIDVYSHITMEYVEERYLSIFNEADSPPVAGERKECPRCGLLIRFEANFCPRCGQPLSSEASFEVLRRIEREEEEVEEAKKLVESFLELATRRPDLVRRLLRGGTRR